MSELDSSPTIKQYKQKMFEQIRLIKPWITYEQIEPVLDESIMKRYKPTNCQVVNTYTNKSGDYSLLTMSDYIKAKSPIVTAYGTMFYRNDSNVDNLLAEVVDSFLTARSVYKKKMFECDKGSEMFNYYNQMQSLEKINVNAIYGTMGQPTSLIYNVNVATSVTSQGRSLVSSMTMFFESFLASSVKFGSLDEVLCFINNVVNERPYRKFKDEEVLDVQYVTPEQCFRRVVMQCGYRWIPNEYELELIWSVIINLSWRDRNRVYYKNNLYAFSDNTIIKNLIRDVMCNLNRPFLTPNDPEENVVVYLDQIVELMREFVYYRYMYIDRIDRCDNMMKNITLVSDTDSTIISLDAWYRFGLDVVKGLNMKINTCIEDPLIHLKRDEFGDLDMSDKETKEWVSPIYELQPEYDYDFLNDELVEIPYKEKPIEPIKVDNVRYSLIDILAYVLDRLVNDYMEKYCENNNSFIKGGPRKCRILAKNEFTFSRLLMTPVKKNYATLQAVQEGNLIPEDQQLDIKGIASMAKSSMSKSTRKALQKILYEDILKADKIDQFKIIKHVAVLEKQITDSLHAGSKEFYKPVTIKAKDTYTHPMRIQGIKASVAWNTLRGPDLPAINLEERNAVDIAKIKVDKETLDMIAYTYPDIYERMIELAHNEYFCKDYDQKGWAHFTLDSIAIPLDVDVPDWLIDIVDFNTLVNDNIGGFVYESVGIQRLGRNSVNYTNILQL